MTNPKTRPPTANSVSTSAAPSESPSDSPISRNELLLVLVITVLGAAVRFEHLDRLAIEHFDEGVYASNLIFPDNGFRYPDRHLYAPSMVPSFIEWSILVFGNANSVPMLQSLIFGTLTIPLLWWIGRTWFSSTAGVTSATLLAFSDVQIAFARSALTDTTLCFWLLLAVGLFEFTFRTRSWLGAILSGVVTGLAWWTKYNGWLPLAIAGSALAASWVIGQLLHRAPALALGVQRLLRHSENNTPPSSAEAVQPPTQSRGLEVMLLVVAAVIAFAMWRWDCLGLPNGYSEVASNHRRYVESWSRWFPNLLRQGAAIRHFSGWLTFMGVVSAIILSWRANRLCLDRRSEPACDQLPNFGNQPERARVRFESPSAHEPDGSAFGLIRRSLFWKRNLLPCLLLAAWWLGLLLSTPHYRAYPRLLLPWHLATLLAAGLALSCLLKRDISKTARRCSGAIVVLFMSVVGFGFSTRSAPTWESRTGLADLAAAVRQIASENIGHSASDQDGFRMAFYVYAEPGILFHLSSDSTAVIPAGNFGFATDAPPRLPTFLVAGPHAQRDPQFQAGIEKVKSQVKLIATFPYDASDFVRLDEVSSTELRSDREPLSIDLYRIVPPAVE